MHNRCNLGHKLLTCAALAAPLLLAACHGANEPAVPAPAAEEIPVGRLPHSVVPVEYDLRLTIDPAADRFTGQTQITLDFAECRSLLWLHGNRLAVEHAALQTADGQTIAGAWRQVNDDGVARIDLDTAYGPGAATLVIDYSAPFDQALEGLYKVVENEIPYAFTQFEAISARLAFPGFDEPGFKTPYTVRITTPAANTAIANAPETAVEDNGDGTLTHVFARTEPLPTYLVAFAVGPFDVATGPHLNRGYPALWRYLEAHDPRDVAAALAAVPPSPAGEVPLRAVAAQGKGADLAYALDQTPSIVHALEGYFNIPYPYAKLDVLAVPDFAAGAMENAGAITYREGLLLLDGHATAEQIRRYESVHAHELAHQWFGNLVTPYWWDDIWLNEAFATWMGATALDRRDPHAGFRLDLKARALGAMAVDSLQSARQIRQPILSNHDIASAFDAITYSKGGGVLSMFESYLGREPYRRAIHDYLEKYAWGNAGADDFITALSRAAKPEERDTVAAAFRSFISQPGVPHLEVGIECGAETSTLNISQKRYLPLGSKAPTAAQWIIPVCLRTLAGAPDCRLLTEPEARWELPDACPAAVIPNAEGAGYYRWHLNGGAWPALIAALPDLPPGEQMSLADSLVAAFEAGKIEFSTFIDGIGKVADQPNHYVASLPVNTLDDLVENLSEPDTSAALKRSLLTIYDGQLERLGLAAQDDYQLAALQSELLAFQTLTLDSNAYDTKLLQWAAAYLNHPDDPDLAINLGVMDTALARALRLAGAALYPRLEAMLGAARDPALRNRLIAALGAVTDAELAGKVRDLALSDKVRNNEAIQLIARQFGQPATRDAAWQWLQTHIDALLERIPHWRQGNVAQLTAGFCTAEKRREIEDFFAPKITALGGGPRALAATLERVELCQAKKAHYGKALAAWMKSTQ